MRKKRIMVIGPTGCGKTTLVNALNDEDKPLRKTQNMIYGKNTIDVPGAYIENAWMYKHLIAAAQDASHILLLVDQSKSADVYSPGFAGAFRIPVTGVIMKCDIAGGNEDACVRQLRRTGVMEPYFRISIPDGKGIEELKRFLFQEKE